MLRRVVAVAGIIAFFWTSQVLVFGAEEAAKIKLPSGKVYKVTKVQIESLKNQPGIRFSQSLPTAVEKGVMAVQVPTELGGGYILGTPSAIASAFNAAGITVGLTAGALTATTATIAGISVASIGAIIAASISGKGAVHHAAPHH